MMNKGNVKLVGGAMKCKKAAKLISTYLDGELSKDRRKDLLQHLDLCESCSKEYEFFKV